MAAAEPLEDGNVLQSFWGLASTDDKERISSARDLLAALSSKQEEIGEGAVAPDVRYSLQRLVRGLASGRKGARQGFFVALTELLAMCEEVTMEEVMKLVDMHLQPHKGIRGTEEKGVYFGRFFALSALFLSGRLTQEEEVLEVTRQFGAIAAKKPFMSEMCAVAIGNLVENACFHSNGGGDLRLEVVREGGVGEGWLGCTPERLYLVLRLDKILRGESWWAELIKSKWSDADYDIITSSRLASVASILEASRSSHSGLHLVWSHVVDVVRKTPLFPQFWQKIVEETLLSSTHKKQLVALTVLESLILPTITEEEVAVAFSAGIVRRILNNAASPSSPLHASVQKLLTTVSSADKPVDTRVALYVHIQYRSGGRFDALTKTETMKRLLSSLDRGGVDRLISKLEEIFRSPEILSAHYDSDDPLSEPHMVQTWVGDQFLAIVKNKSFPKSSNLLLDIAKLLLCHAHYSSSSDQLHIAAVEPQVQRLCSTRLMGVLAELCTLTTPTKPTKKGEEGEERKSRRQPGRMEETGRHYLVSLVLYAQQLPSNPLQNKALAAWEYVGSVLCDMEERGDGGLQLEESAFQLLFAAVGLELLRDPQSATETVGDLRQCYEDMKREVEKRAKPQTYKTPRKKKKRREEEEEEEDDESESRLGWVEVLVDLLLGLESRQSQLWRGVVEQVFRGVVHRVTPGAVQLIANVLRPQKKEELMEKEGESEEEEEEEEEESGSEKEEEVDPKLREDVMKALGSVAVQSEDESDVSMSDGEMERIDKALSEAFRSRMQEKSSKKDEAKSVVHFKLRVLDLVQVLLQRLHSSPVILELILPLYHMTRSARNKPDHAPLVSRAVPLFCGRLCRSRKIPKEELDETNIHSILQQMIQCLYKDNDQQSARLLTEGILFLMKVLISSPPPPPPVSPLTTRSGRKRKRELQETAPALFGSLDVATVTGWLSDALHDYLVKKNSLVHLQVFFAIFERYPALAWRLVVRMLADLPNAGNRFRKLQGLELSCRLLATKISEKEFVTVALPRVDGVVSFCRTELSDWVEKPDKLVKQVLKLVSKLATSLKEHNQWSESWQESLIGALHHPVSSSERSEGVGTVRGGEGTRREWEKVREELETEKIEEGATKKRKRGPRKRTTDKKL